MPRRTTQQEKKNQKHKHHRTLANRHLLHAAHEDTLPDGSTGPTALRFSLSAQGRLLTAHPLGAAASKDAAGAAPCPGDAAGYELTGSSALCSPCPSWTDSTPDVKTPRTSRFPPSVLS